VRIDDAFELAKLQAATDGAIDERLLRHWFEAAWALCAAAIGLTYPERNLTETVEVQGNGTVRLSRTPSGPVRLYSCGVLVETLPATSPLIVNNAPNLPNPYQGFGEFSSGQSVLCLPSLCCHCDLTAVYPVGSSDPCGEQDATFVQAVLRLFTYMCENRGDVEMNPEILSTSGANAFLSQQLTYLM